MKMPASRGGGERKGKKKKKKINVHYGHNYFRLENEIVLPMRARFKGVWKSIFVVTIHFPTIVGNFDAGKRYLFIYIFFYSPLLTNIWRALHLFATENSIIPWNLHEWKKGMGREPWVYKIQCVGSQREREREKKEKKKKKLGEERTGEEKILVGILKFDIFEYAIESNHRIRVPTPLQFRPPIFVPSPLPPSILFFFNARPSARSKENQGEEKKNRSEIQERPDRDRKVLRNHGVTLWSVTF